MMGFSLELFFIDLFVILDSDMKTHKKIKALHRIIKDARECADYLVRLETKDNKK